MKLLNLYCHGTEMCSYYFMTTGTRMLNNKELYIFTICVNKIIV